METPIQKVSEFHATFRHPILPNPQIPPIERAKLRISLLQEELNELQTAINNNDVIEAADALCDLQYVLSGAVLEFGMGNCFDLIFSEVHRSNMSKACFTQQEAEQTIEAYKKLDGTDAYFEEVENKGLFLVYRISDNKTLKSINYSPASIKTFLC